MIALRLVRHPVSIIIVAPGTAIVLRVNVPPLVIVRRSMTIAMTLALSCSAISRVIIVIFTATPLVIVAVRLTSWVLIYITTPIYFPLLVITLTIVIFVFSVRSWDMTIIWIGTSYINTPTQLWRWIVLWCRTIIVPIWRVMMIYIWWVLPITTIVVVIGVLCTSVVILAVWSWVATSATRISMAIVPWHACRVLTTLCTIMILKTSIVSTVVRTSSIK